MLKSHFNLTNTEVAEEQEASVIPSSLHGEMLEHEDSGSEEIPILYPVRKLNRSEVSIRLSLLGKVAEGDGYTYLKATCTGMSLTDISALKSFKHLQFVDVSNNNLNLESLQAITEIPFLVLIHADKNILNSAALKRMKYMQVIIMNNNNITSVHDVYQPELSTLEVGYNRIPKIHFDNRMPTLRCLDFRYNLIRELPEMAFPNLDSLYLAGNKITSLIGLEKLVNLRVLHVRNNPIKSLTGFDAGMSKLLYINLRNCKVATLIQVKKLRVLTGLEVLILKGCPIMGGTGDEKAEVAAEEDDAELRVEILASLPRLKRINKLAITPEERTEAEAMMKVWLEEGEVDEEELQEEQGEVESNED